jgi:hypothetical protein
MSVKQRTCSRSSRPLSILRRRPIVDGILRCQGRAAWQGHRQGRARRRGLEGAGLQAQGGIQAQIEATNSPPLSDMTLLLRK